MTFNSPLETIVFIFIAIALIKIVVILLNKKSWLSVSQKVYKNSKASGPISLILAAIVFYYILQELTIIQIMAVVTFTTLLIAFAFLSYSKDLHQIGKKILSKKFTPGMIFYILIWLALILWALYELFF
jgi:hypothetical protein